MSFITRKKIADEMMWGYQVLYNLTDEETKALDVTVFNSIDLKIDVTKIRDELNSILEKRK